MERKIVKIDEEKCIGCGLCVKACHEGAIALVNGKAKLIKDDYCDGLGDCLPHCPTDAISIEVKETVKFNKEEVEFNLKDKVFKPLPSTILNWPIQLKLTSVKSKYFDNGHLLIGASCTAFTYKKFHDEFMQKRALLIGCSKLDGVDYTRKLADIFANNNILSICLVKMEVPCCTGLENMVKNALAISNKNIPMSVRVISIKGDLIECY